MIHNTSRKALLPALSAALLGITLAGCGGNAPADNTTTTTDTSTTAPGTTTATATNTASTDTGSPSNGTGSTGNTTPAAGSGGVSVTGKAGASFAGASAVWSQVMAANAALDKVIKSKNLKTVHEAAFKVRDIVKTLPAKSQALSPDKQKSLASQVKNIEQLAGKLDEAGDSNNLKETQEDQAGLNDALDIIKGLYPAGALK